MTQQTPAKRKAFKDWFDSDAVNALAQQLSGAGDAFDRERFINQSTDGLDGLEMMDRVKQMSDAMAAALPSDRERALQHIISTLPPPLPDCTSVTDGWLQWPVGQFIADYCLDVRDTAFTAMTELTRRFSSEFAVRPFAEQDPVDTVHRLTELSAHSCPHVRRWCSEGLRPRLPWGRRLDPFITPPATVWPLLENLKADPEPYVRRSVANHLNDLTKEHPKEVLERVRSWIGDTPDTDRLVRHGLRTLIKQGHPDTLNLLGYSSPVQIRARLTPSATGVSIGDSLTLTATLENRSPGPTPLLIDYTVHFVRSGGRSTPKVFKWTTLDLNGHEVRELTKLHRFRQTTVRTLYPGPHRIDLQVNGRRIASCSVTLS